LQREIHHSAGTEATTFWAQGLGSIISGNPGANCATLRNHVKSGHAPTIAWLKERLAGSNDWIESDGAQVTQPVLGGQGPGGYQPKPCEPDCSTTPFAP
jgi:hypothetical protein